MIADRGDACHSVAEAYRFVTQSAFLERSALEVLAGWIWTTGDLDAKLAFGAHAHEDAVHADMLGRRAAELRPSLPDYGDRYPPVADAASGDICRAIARAPTTAEKLAGLYGALKAWLLARYEAFAAAADPVLEAPTLRVLDTIIRDERRQVAWGRQALAARTGQDPAAQRAAEQWAARVAGYLGEAMGGAATVAPPASAAPGPLVPLDTARPAGDPRMRIVYYTPGAGPSSEVDFDPRTETEIRQVMLTTMICQETEAVELLARVLAEFPDLPWEMRLQLSRQMWDECRHAEAQRAILRSLGADIGAYPAVAVINGLVGDEPDVLKRLLVLQRVVEGTVIDQHRPRARFFREHGAHPLALMLDYVMADEDTHIALSRWVNRLLAEAPERASELAAYQARKEGEMAAYVDWLVTKRRDLARSYAATSASARGGGA